MLLTVGRLLHGRWLYPVGHSLSQATAPTGHEMPAIRRLRSRIWSGNRDCQILLPALRHVVVAVYGAREGCEGQRAIGRQGIAPNCAR
jgi:hypothetical protein